METENQQSQQQQQPHSSPPPPPRDMVVAVVEMESRRSLSPPSSSHKEDEDDKVVMHRRKVRLDATTKLIDFRNVILQKLQQQEMVEGNNNDTHPFSVPFSCLEVCVYDTQVQDYVVLFPSDETTSATNMMMTVAARFGSRLRVRITTTNTAAAASSSKPLLALPGRFFDFDGSTFAVRPNAVLHIHPGAPPAGDIIKTTTTTKDHVIETADTVWDGALLMAHFLIQQQDLDLVDVRNKVVLELGAGCGLVGMVAAVLGAHHVILTDVPCVVPRLESNVQQNQHLWEEHASSSSSSSRASSSSSKRVRCVPCDWYHPPKDWRDLLSSITEASSKPDLILVADCVWMPELVDPLFNTMDRLLLDDCLSSSTTTTTTTATTNEDIRQQPNDTNQAPESKTTKVLFAYQRRGFSTHVAFWEGLQRTFSVITTLPPVTPNQPDVLTLLLCTK